MPLSSKLADATGERAARGGRRYVTPTRRRGPRPKDSPPARSSLLLSGLCCCGASASVDGHHAADAAWGACPPRPLLAVFCDTMSSVTRLPHHRRRLSSKWAPPACCGQIRTVYTCHRRVRQPVCHTRGCNAAADVDRPALHCAAQMTKLCEAVAALHDAGHRVVLVSSGAVGAGCQRLGAGVALARTCERLVLRHALGRTVELSGPRRGLCLLWRPAG